MFPIRIAVGDISVEGELNDTEGARALARLLPVTAEFRVWGDELHLDVALDEALRGRPDANVAVGDLALSSNGDTLCLFFGPTPLSSREQPVAALPVIVVGRLREAQRLRAGKMAGELTISAHNGREA